MHPVAFHFGPFTVTWYGIMVAMGFLAGLWTASRRAPYGGLTAESILDLGPWLIIGAIIGARVLYVIMFWQQFAGHPLTELFTVWRGGLVFYGGFIGATSTSVLFARIKRVPLWKLADAVAPSIALGYAFGRIGCLMNGCCHGSECQLPWAISYPDGPRGVHPTQVYDALWGFALYAFLARFYRRKMFEGQVFATFLLAYGVFRFLTEFSRGDYAPHQLFFGGHVTPGQIVSLAVISAGVVLWRVLPRADAPLQDARARKVTPRDGRML